MQHVSFVLKIKLMSPRLILVATMVMAKKTQNSLMSPVISIQAEWESRGVSGEDITRCYF
jgi:hypothetical protein